MRAPIREGQSGSGDQVSHGARDQDLVRAGEAHDARPDVNGDRGDAGLHDVELSGVKARADSDTKLMDTLDNRERAADRAGWPVEDGKEAVASSIDLSAAKTSELAANEAVMVADEGAPSCIAQLNGPTGGLDHVREEHGRQDAGRFRAVAGASEEFLDLVQDGVGVADPCEMVDAGKLDESRARNALGEVAAAADCDASVAGAMEDERRDVNGGQDVPDIDLERHLQDRPRSSRTGAESQVLAPPSFEPIVIGHARRPYFDLGGTAPISLHGAEIVAVLFDRGRPGIGGVTHAFGVGAVQDQRCYTLWVGRGEQHAHRSAFGDSEQGSSLRAGRIHHRTHVVHAFFQRWQLVDRNSIGEPGPPLVEEDQPAERGEALEETREVGIFPGVFDVRDKAQYENEIEGGVSYDLVRNAVVTAPGVSRSRSNAHSAGIIGSAKKRRSHALRGYVRAGICCTDHVFPSGSLKYVNEPQGCTSTSLASTPRLASSWRTASTSSTTT